jgi:hypothetical protein
MSYKDLCIHNLLNWLFSFIELQPVQVLHCVSFHCAPPSFYLYSLFILIFTVSVCLQYHSIYNVLMCYITRFSLQRALLCPIFLPSVHSLLPSSVSTCVQNPSIYSFYLCLLFICISTVHKNPWSIHISTVSIDLQFPFTYGIYLSTAPSVYLSIFNSFNLPLDSSF